MCDRILHIPFTHIAETINCSFLTERTKYLFFFATVLDNISDHLSVCTFFFKLIFNFFDFQKGPELNKLFYKEDMHILHNYEKYFKKLYE
jgi:hypothetical protein